MRRVVASFGASFILVAALLWAGEAAAQKQPRTAAPSRDAEMPGGPPQPQVRSSTSPASVAEHIEACRRNVMQLDEQLRARQKKLLSLRNERKSVGLSGGEVAKFKLSSLDQEIRELSRQSEQLIAQIDSENARCEQLATKVSNRAGAPQPQAKPPQQQQNQRPNKPRSGQRSRQ
jgi:predicted RNase H-like nuclease (RuvC/YqgF family)